MDKDDRIMRAYARLSALRSRLGEDRHASFEKAYVDELHQALEHLTACGFDVDEFKVTPEQLHAGSVLGRSFVDRNLLLAKLDAVLKYFTLATAQPPAPKKAPIGFRPPDG